MTANMLIAFIEGVLVLSLVVRSTLTILLVDKNNVDRMSNKDTVLFMGHSNYVVVR